MTAIPPTENWESGSSRGTVSLPRGLVLSWGGELGLPGGLPLVTLVLALLLLETFQTVKTALVMLQAWLGIPLQKTRQEVSSLEHKV